MYLYRAVDKAGQTVDFFLSRNRDVNAAKSFASLLGPRRSENYYRIVPYSWYLSIIGVGATLLADTLAEAGYVCCYLKTFAPRSVRPYERLGFSWVAEHLEPTTSKT